MTTIDVSSGGICVGYGGLEIAIAAALRMTAPEIDVHHRWFAEFDDNAAQVLAEHWPDVPNLGDVTRVDWATTSPVTIFAGGIPCQPYSAIGKRAGSLDERDLWPVCKTGDDGRPRRGALDAIDRHRPHLVVIENVAGLLVAEDGTPFGVVLADLTRLGYATSWTTVGACKVGASHHRHRVYIVATLADVADRTTEPAAYLNLTDSTWSTGQAPLFGPAAPVKWPPSGLAVDGRMWELPADTCGLKGGITPVPTPRARDAKGRDPNPRGLDLNEAVSRMPSDNDGGSSGDMMPPSAVQPGRFGDYETAVRRQEASFGRLAPEPTEPGSKGRPRLAAVFSEWMMGLPRGWITGVVDRRAALKIAGNGVVWQAAAYALTTLPTFHAAVPLLRCELMLAA